jgi:hypothetical protein
MAENDPSHLLLGHQKETENRALLDPLGLDPPIPKRSVFASSSKKNIKVSSPGATNIVKPSKISSPLPHEDISRPLILP